MRATADKNMHNPLHPKIIAKRSAARDRMDLTMAKCALAKAQMDLITIHMMYEELRGDGDPESRYTKALKEPDVQEITRTLDKLRD